ncbi:ABC transporter permease [Sneathiella limimaris]|uniref:ABC transporter permease n=1 Tax=Sneathiella limimaris TaxID=1964213 RepID=UPI00146E43FF|nr:ABC transporter permease [Sneathiella limimaris]
MRSLFQTAVTLFGLLAIWLFIVWVTDVPKFILPNPAEVLLQFKEKYSTLSYHASITTLEIILGLLIGTILGLVTGLTVSLHASVRRWVLPVLIASQAIPVFAIAPLLVLWFDYGITSKVVMATLIIYFPVTVAFVDGLNRTPHDWLDLAKLQQETSSSGRFLQTIRLYRTLKIPFALPSLASGIRVAAAVAPIGAVVGEWVGSSAGLGYLMLHANGRMQTDLMFASLFTLALIAISLYYLVDYLLRRAISWI